MSYAKDGTVRRLEESISRMRGVRRARVDLAQGKISAVRVLVVPERAPDQTLRQVLELIRRETGEPVSDDLVQILRSSRSQTHPMQRRRLASIATERTPERFSARVVIELCGDTLEGESESPNERAPALRSIARATLHSLSELLPQPVALESVDVFDSGLRELAVVALTHGKDALVGSAIVRLDQHDAVARATLDAVNRVVALTPVGATDASVV